MVKRQGEGHQRENMYYICMRLHEQIINNNNNTIYSLVMLVLIV
uniref:Uncharacterized protein n=1 Tax=Amphimedon queenslandica TaxID=400682 RepID=A0A1X7VVR3_AMPQE